MKFKKYEYTISLVFISALFYGDTSELDDLESELFDDFISCDLFAHGHWALPEDLSESYDRCDISFKFGNCFNVPFYKEIRNEA